MSITWDASWGTGRGASHKRTVEGALERIMRMLNSAFLAVKAIKPAAQMPQQGQRTTYVQHFSDPTLVELGEVTRVITAMYSRICKSSQTIVMSDVPDMTTFNGLSVGPLPACVNFQNVEAFVIHRGVAPGTALSVYICPAFFKGNVYIPKSVNQRTGTGTVLHELSHGVGNTADHAYTWEGTYATLSANQRARNADSYRAYCQSFDQ